MKQKFSLQIFGWKVFILLSLYFIGFYIEAGAAQMLEIKKNAVSAPIAEAQKPLVNQTPPAGAKPIEEVKPIEKKPIEAKPIEAKPIEKKPAETYLNSNNIKISKKVRRGVFSNMSIGTAYYFIDSQFGLSVRGNYGLVVSRETIVPEGIFELQAGLDSQIINTWTGRNRLNVYLIWEINFIKNDSINMVIPGMDLFGSYNLLGYGNLFTTRKTNIAHSISIGSGFFLKLFISKQFALVPRLSIEYMTEAERRSTGDNVVLGFDIGVRIY